MAEPDPRTAEEQAALRHLEARLARATETAERLLAQARREDGAADPAESVPPRGWQRRDAGAPPRPWEGWIAAEDAELLLGVLAAARELVPAELQERVVVALRELLLAVRALIDWCLERSERRAATSADVQDIPIL
jgi:hypothetical protein